MATTSASRLMTLLSMEKMVSRDMGVPSSTWDAPMMNPYARYCRV